jgi:hypothetical protein
MAHLHTNLRGVLTGVAVGSALLLSACADGIDLNGKLFDVMGVSSSALDAKRAEPKVAERAPLVMPPNVNRLPEPGSERPAPVLAAAQPGSGQTAWPDDPEARKARQAQERERLHQAYCRGDIQWKEKVLNRESVGAPRSPYGPCSALVGAATESLNVNKE